MLILTDEIQDTEFLNFAVENISELFGYLATGRVNIRICRDITGPHSPSILLSQRAATVQESAGAMNGGGCGLG